MNVATKPSTTGHVLVLNPMLKYTQHPDKAGNLCPIIWDLREEPVLSARPSSSPERNFDLVVGSDLLKDATSPPTTTLRIYCPLIPNDPIVAHNSCCLSVHDVLSAIYKAVCKRIRHSQWDALSQKERDRISTVWTERCQSSDDIQRTRENGVLGMDCLVYHVWFSGLEWVPEIQGCVLSLKRENGSPS
ncbi:hypothetical protein DL96DRAFT_1621833 [Flagelloscypha sp. PMI_526]|nr:hypothetical protein DL96DRAFT_1621833 [Flagelloscypha sp. PMI_526]